MQTVSARFCARPPAILPREPDPALRGNALLWLLFSPQFGVFTPKKSILLANYEKDPVRVFDVAGARALRVPEEPCRGQVGGHLEGRAAAADRLRVHRVQVVEDVPVRRYGPRQVRCPGRHGRGEAVPGRFPGVPPERARPDVLRDERRKALLE